MPPKPSRTPTETIVETTSNSQDIKSKLSREGKLLVTFMEEAISKLKTDLEFVIQSKNLEIHELKSEVDVLRDEVKKLKYMVDDADAYERRDTVIISGDALPTATTGEICSEIVREVVKTELKMTLPTDSISTVHRLGKNLKTNP